MGILFSFVQSLLDFLFPKTKKVLELESLPTHRFAELLKRAELNEKDICALFDYSHPLTKEIVWQIKYSGNRNLADKMGELLYDELISECGERNFFNDGHSIILLPVPVSDKRRNERGWNQAELLAQAIKKRDTKYFKYLPRHLAKVMHTESQTKTSGRKERLENLKGSMKMLNTEIVRGRTVVLVDDVTTTGATFAEARRALRDAGAKKVLCLALAH